MSIQYLASPSCLHCCLKKLTCPASPRPPRLMTALVRTIQLNECRQRSARVCAPSPAPLPLPYARPRHSPSCCEELQGPLLSLTPAIHTSLVPPLPFFQLLHVLLDHGHAALTVNTNHGWQASQLVVQGRGRVWRERTSEVRSPAVPLNGPHVHRPRRH